jgi:2-polyprenyl-3-methyl-5-hydroxy-6-metoxy-1,4-benzoquinol methylase
MDIMRSRLYELHYAHHRIAKIDGKELMSHYREVLIQQYIRHYSRINRSINPADLYLHNLASMQLMYGNLIASLPSGGKVLDLGCGTGILLSWLARQPGIVSVGVDSSGTQIESAKRNLPNIEITCADGLVYLRKHPEEFDGIFCTDMLEHIPDLDLCFDWLEAAREALRPGGFFFCRVPNAANLTGTYSRYMDLTHERCFTSASLLQLLEAGGFEKCRIIPIQAAHLSGRIRLVMEAFLHRAVFRICGRGLERVFTYNVCAVGFVKLTGE